MVALTVIAGTIGPQSATLTLDIEGDHKTVQSTGNGPVDAIFNAIKALIAARGEAGALPGARRDGGHRRAGRGVGAARGPTAAASRRAAADPDTLVASAKAYIGGLNRLLERRHQPGHQHVAAV